MFSTIRRLLSRDKEKYRVPRKVQDIIPIKAIWPDGIFLTGRNRYSMLLVFTDINFTVAANDVKKSMIEQYAEIINSFDSECSYKLGINNRMFNRHDFEDDVLIELLNNRLDELREEYNGIMTNIAVGSNSIIQDKYVLIAVYEKNVNDARIRLNRIGGELRGYFSRMGSIARDMDANDRLRIIHDFFRQGEETYFNFDFKEMMKKGYDFRDYVCPDSSRITATISKWDLGLVAFYCSETLLRI